MNRSPHLVGLTGHAGVGKNTFAERFHFFGYREYSLAGPVKSVCLDAFNISQLHFIDRQLKEEKHPYWNLSPREMAQLVGTEMFRKQFGEDFWIRRLELSLILDFDSKPEVKAIVTDVRFQNEADWIIANGGVIIHLTREGFNGNVGIPGHASEAGIVPNDSYIYGENYYEISNEGNISELQDLAQFFIEKHLSNRK